METDDNHVYYRIYKLRNEKYGVVCMQWFDEYDYINENFLCEKGTQQYTGSYPDNRLVFNTEGEALQFLNGNIKRELIDEESLIATKDDIWKE